MTGIIALRCSLSLAAALVTPQTVIYKNAISTRGRRRFSMSFLENTNSPPLPPVPAAAASALTKSHYEGHSADSYDSAFFYEVGPYTERLRDLCQARLQLLDDHPHHQAAVDNVADADAVKTGRVLLDIGGGTGTFTRMLIQDNNATCCCRAIVIDPFLEKQQNNAQQQQQQSSSDDEPVRFVAAPAEAFMSDPMPGEEGWRRGYHQILLKEVAHHFADQDRTAIFRGLWDGLVARKTTTTTNGSSPPPPPPSLLLITRPQIDIDYPLWDEARAVWAQNQPSLDQFVSELHAAGFTDISHTLEAHPCVVPLERWQSMVKARFWSTFGSFSDAELERACDAMAANEKHRITADGNLHFDDRLLFITANKD